MLSAKEKALIGCSVSSLAILIAIYPLIKKRLKRYNINNLISFIILYNFLSIIFPEIYKIKSLAFFTKKIIVIKIFFCDKLYLISFKFGTFFYDFFIVIYLKVIFKIFYLLPKDLSNLLFFIFSTGKDFCLSLYSIVFLVFKKELREVFQWLFLLSYKSPLFLDILFYSYLVFSRFIRFLILFGVILAVPLSRKTMVELLFKKKNFSDLTIKKVFLQGYNVHVLVKIEQFHSCKGLLSKSSFLASHCLVIFLMFKTTKSFVSCFKNA